MTANAIYVSHSYLRESILNRATLDNTHMHINVFRKFNALQTTARKFQQQNNLGI